MKLLFALLLTVAVISPARAVENDPDSVAADKADSQARYLCLNDLYKQQVGPAEQQRQCHEAKKEADKLKGVVNAAEEKKRQAFNDHMAEERRKDKEFKAGLAKKPGVRIGMTENQVVNKTSWGYPVSVRRTVTRYGEHQQWVYEGAYLYFENGKLTAIQD
jgi:hypothetical protein